MEHMAKVKISVTEDFVYTHGGNPALADVAEDREEEEERLEEQADDNDDREELAE
ncbi:hypothetical protein EUX98_g9359 [Antrodiella citrinella]|uniref:Uncharacterized protein n=1 Tax=Antrodiella citrinella TaxID=2447956 RepID=A0A4V3XF43_9APHY|nr:hypothetical protein EUX98_g9359 [Antrodiella citrinella]